jgi:serine protease Do
MDMKPVIIPTLGLAIWHSVAVAQIEPPLPRPEEQQAVDAQSAELFQSMKPLLAAASKSTVRIWAGNRRLAYGTVIGDGHKILTKWSEVARAQSNLRIDTPGGAVLPVKITGVYEEDDLALLDTGSTTLTPIQWSKESPKLGAFLTATQPDGRPAAFGVVSVLERNLRDTDQAYLGVICMMDYPGPGVKIQEVAPDSGAFSSGLKAGNIILKVGERPISGPMELRNALMGTKPGSTVSLLMQTGTGEKKLAVQLGNRPLLPNFPGDRLRQMETMGGPISRVRDSFTHAIQSDMRLQPDQIGGPVVDLKGRVVGITLARADRTRSFIMPAAAIENLLLKDPQNPAAAQVRRSDQAPALSQRRQTPRGFAPPASEEQMRRHILDMQRLMDFLAEEMDGLEPQR